MGIRVTSCLKGVKRPATNYNLQYPVYKWWFAQSQDHFVDLPAQNILSYQKSRRAIFNGIVYFSYHCS